MIFAVHISANVLAPMWVVLGFLGTGVLLSIGMSRLREEEIARVGLVTAALFIASSIHVSLGPSSVHLLLNGLAGVMLGRRVCASIPISLLLQATLLGHGDISTLGVNTCVLTLPALAARPLFRLTLGGWRLGAREGILASVGVLWPWSLIAIAPTIFIAQRLGRRAISTDAARAGFVLGACSVAATSLLHSIVLAWGGEEDFTAVAVLSLAAHLPVALVEGLILAATTDFLMRVKPSMLVPGAVIPSASLHPAALPIAPAPR